MRDFQHRKKVRRLIYSRNVAIVLGIIAILLARGAYNVWQKERESSKNAEEVAKSLDAAKTKNAELSHKVEILETEAGIERELRQKFSVSKEGEEMVVLIEQTNSTSSQNSPRKGFWAKIGTWFGGLFD